MTNNSVIASLRCFIDEIIRIQSPQELDNDKLFIPSMINTGPDVGITVNDNIESDILIIGEFYYENLASAKDKYNKKEWLQMVRAAIGRSIIDHEYSYHNINSAKIIKEYIEKEIDNNFITSDSRFTSIGCSFLSVGSALPFIVGPVTIESKLSWLDNALTKRFIPENLQAGVINRFTGSSVSSSDKEGNEPIVKSIVDAFNDAQMICTIETNGLAPDMSRHRAITGARICQTAIALLWPVPSQILSRLHLSVDNSCRSIRTISFVPGKSWGSNYSLRGMPTGLHMKAEEWEALTNSARGYFDVAGKMISCWTSAIAYQSAPPILRNLAQAIHFFWEGCRDENDLMAIVKFTACLEALAQGKTAGILNLVNARFGKNNDDKIVGDKTLKQVVELIYSMGRSRTLHGSNPNIHHDWSDERAIAEGLTRHCLFACMRWFEQNPNAKDAKAFLS